eukprot:548821-Hanusia_phi.AAC.3
MQQVDAVQRRIHVELDVLLLYVFVGPQAVAQVLHRAGEMYPQLLQRDVDLLEVAPRGAAVQLQHVREDGMHGPDGGCQRVVQEVCPAPRARVGRALCFGQRLQHGGRRALVEVGGRQRLALCLRPLELADEHALQAVQDDLDEVVRILVQAVQIPDELLLQEVQLVVQPGVVLGGRCACVVGLARAVGSPCAVAPPVAVRVGLGVEADPGVARCTSVHAQFGVEEARVGVEQAHVGVEALHHLLVELLAREQGREACRAEGGGLQAPLLVLPVVGGDVLRPRLLQRLRELLRLGFGDAVTYCLPEGYQLVQGLVQHVPQVLLPALDYFDVAVVLRLVAPPQYFQLLGLHRVRYHPLQCLVNGHERVVQVGAVHVVEEGIIHEACALVVHGGEPHCP